MDLAVVDTYLAGVDPAAAPLVRTLDEIVRTTEPGLAVAVKYKILMYALGNDWRTWVCAIDASARRVSLRFLYGVLLDDPLGVLRAGSSVLESWDFALDDEVDAPAVAAYVTEAVGKYATYKENAADILRATRAGIRSRRPATDG